MAEIKKNNEFDKVEYWIETSEYDFETAKVMLKSKRYIYVGFMCNLAIEKILKAYYVFEKNEMPPYTHNLRRIATESNIYKHLNEEKCNKLIKGTEGFIKWIKTKLEN